MDIKLSKDKAITLFDLFEKVVKSSLCGVFEYLETNKYVAKYYNYPKEIFSSVKGTETYNELYESVEAFKYGIPLFHITNYDTPLNYGEILSLHNGQFTVSCDKIEGFIELVTFIKNHTIISSMFSEKEEYLESAMVYCIGNIVNRYMYETNTFIKSDINNDVLHLLIEQQLNRILSPKLPISICVPICFIVFDEDEIKIADNISIKKMSYDFQISRCHINKFESTQMNQLVQCASYMFYIDNYTLQNDSRKSFENVSTNHYGYPTELINDLFASMRIVTGYKTGYGQLIIEPHNWANKWTANLLPLYGTIIQAFNTKEINTSFYNYHINRITSHQIDDIKEIFSVLQEKRKGTPKEFNKVFIALKRLNRCMLREEDDDTALDAIIGIETLLSGDTHGEITYTISNRMAVVASRLKECAYTPLEARSAMKKIYGLRSDIVHGREISNNKQIQIQGRNIDTKELAIEFLRYSLLFIIRNQDYLDIKAFEKTLDDALNVYEKPANDNNVEK